MLRIGIVDDHLLFRKSLAMLINSMERMKVVIEAKNGNDFLKQLKDKTIDIVLLDLQMPVMDGYQTCKKLLKRFPAIKILIVSQIATKESIHKIIEIGAHGYFTKNSNPEELETAIRSLDAEGFYFGEEISKVVKQALMLKPSPLSNEVYTLDLFTDRELQILKMICKEMKSQEIADELFINLRTIESHRKNIIEKTKSINFIGAILFALKNGILKIDDL